MRFRLLMVLLAGLLTVGSVAAQDAGNADSLVAEFTYVPPNADSIAAGHDSVVVSIYALNDYTVTAMSSGWKWACPEMVMDSARYSDEFITFFESGRFRYWKNSLDSSNVYHKWQLAGITYEPELGLHAGRTRCATWWFHLTDVPDSIAIDTNKLPSLNFNVEFIVAEFAPKLNVPLVVKYNGTSVNSIGDGTLPTKFDLAQNYPNPFNPSTRIRFDLPERTHVNLSVFNVLGQKVATLVDEDLAPDSYERVWYGNSDSGAKVASGIYFYRLTAADKTLTKKMMMLK